jgi:hypothetical protein
VTAQQRGQQPGDPPASRVVRAEGEEGGGSRQDGDHHPDGEPVGGPREQDGHGQEAQERHGRLAGTQAGAGRAAQRPGERPVVAVGVEGVHALSDLSRRPASW